MTRTDNPADVGSHIFERANLGPPPYRFQGVSEIVYQAHPGAPVQAAGSCHYCGANVRYAYWLLAANGHRFYVGCDCINRSGDGGLIAAYKRSPEHRALERERRKARDERVTAELVRLLALEDPKLDQPRPPRWDRDTLVETHRAYYARIVRLCGAAGRARWMKQLKDFIEA